jgi:hypothetical protein
MLLTQVLGSFFGSGFPDLAPPHSRVSGSGSQPSTISVGPPPLRSNLYVLPGLRGRIDALHKTSVLVFSRFWSPLANYPGILLTPSLCLRSSSLIQATSCCRPESSSIPHPWTKERWSTSGLVCRGRAEWFLQVRPPRKFFLLEIYKILEHHREVERSSSCCFTFTFPLTFFWRALPFSYPPTFFMQGVALSPARPAVAA